LPYHFLFLTVAFSALAFYYRSFPVFSNYWFTAFLVYIATFYPYKELTQIRHGLAIAVAFRAIEYIKKRNFPKFLFYCLIATSFHHGLFIFIFLYPLCSINWTYKKITALIIVALGTMQLTWLDILLDLIFNKFGLEFKRLYVLWTNPEAYVEIGYVKFFAYLILLVVALAMRKRLSVENPYYDIACIMLVCGICLSAMLHEFRELAERLAAVFYTGSFIILPQVAYGILPRSYRYLGIFAVWAFCGIMLGQTLEILKPR